MVVPLLKLRDQAQTIALSGELSLAISDNKMGEIGELAQSFETMLRTIAQSKLLQQELEERFRLIFEKSGEAILFAWPDGRIELANPEAMKLFGLTQEEFRQINRGGVMDLGDPRLLPALDERQRTGIYRGELRCRRKNGTYFPVEVVSSVFVDSYGQQRTSSFFRDISERKAIENQLKNRLTEIRLREKALSAVSQGVLICGPDRLTSFVNEEFVRITGYTAQDILGQPCNILQGIDSAPETIIQIRQALEKHLPFHGEILNYRKDGSPFWNELSITPVFDESGSLSQFVGVQRDITARKNTEKALRASQVLISTVFNSLDEIVVVLDANGSIVAVNDAWRDFAQNNLAPESICQGLGLNYLTTCSPAAEGDCTDESGEARDGLAAVLERRKELFELEYPCHSPTEERWFKMRALPLRSAEGGALVLHENITLRKRLESESREAMRHITRLSRHLVAVQEEARRRLAAELHDMTSPNLAAIGINLEVATIALQEGNLVELAARNEDIDALIQETTENIRDICSDLRPPALDYAGLLPACEAYIDRFSKRFRIKTSLESDDSGTRLPSEMESIIFRIFQEALTNVAKHARANTVNVQLQTTNYPLSLLISDDGCGFDPKQSSPDSGLGILNMRDMSEFLGGSFSIQSETGKGTRIFVQFPSTKGAP